VQLRKAGELFRQDIAKSLEPTTALLSGVIHQLEPKRKKFEVYESSSSEVLQLIEPLLTRGDTRTQEKKAAYMYLTKEG